MPVRAPSIQGCGCVVSFGQRCQHMQARDKARRAASDAQRPTAAARGYDSKWVSARKGFLARHSQCGRPSCIQPATIVDHIIPHRGDMKIFWDRSNWQPLCTPCHSGWKQSLERHGQ